MIFIKRRTLKRQRIFSFARIHNRKEVFFMKDSSCCSSSTYANKCIECTVTQCKHHTQGQNYCSLDKIQVGTHEKNPTVPSCTDCNSFAPKQTT